MLKRIIHLENYYRLALGKQSVLEYYKNIAVLVENFGIDYE